MNRRKLLLRGGIGSLALASIPAALHGSAEPARAEHDATVYEFVCVSAAGVVDGVLHLVAASGHGSFSESQALGGGTFTHFDGLTASLIGQGLWRARRLVNWNSTGWAGLLGSGILDMEVDLLPQISPPGTPAVIPATLRVVCDLGDFGLPAGHPEGITLTLPRATGLPAFMPITDPAPVGLTLFSRTTM